MVARLLALVLANVDNDALYSLWKYIGIIMVPGTIVCQQVNHSRYHLKEETQGRAEPITCDLLLSSAAFQLPFISNNAGPVVHHGQHALANVHPMHSPPIPTDQLRKDPPTPANPIPDHIPASPHRREEPPAIRECETI